MARQSIGVGSAPNDGTGDPLRTGGIKLNDMTLELYRSVRFASGTIDALPTILPGKVFATDPFTGQPTLQDFPTLSALGNVPFFNTYAAVQSASISGAGTTTLAILIGGRLTQGDFGGTMLAIYSASAPVHTGYLQSIDGAYWIFKPSFVVSAMFSSVAVAAQAAFLMDVRMILTADQTATITINPLTEASPATDAGRNDYIASAFRWAGRTVGANDSTVEISIIGGAEIRTLGQILVQDVNSAGFSTVPIRVVFPSWTTLTATGIAYNSIVTGSTTAAYARRSGIIAATVKDTAQGSGYTGPSFPVTVTGVGAGTTATAYVTGGAVIACVIDEPGDGWTDGAAATFDFSAGGGTGAAVSTFGDNGYLFNTGLISVVLTVTGTIPANCVVGMPVVLNVNANEDGGALNGSGIVNGVDIANSRVSVWWTAPAGALVSPSAITTATIGFPNTWITATGGWTGLASEGWISGGQGTTLQFVRLALAWNGDSQVYGYKTRQGGIFVGLLGGKLHFFSGPAAIVGFPANQLRCIHMAASYLNNLSMGGGRTGGSGIVWQNSGGTLQIAGGSYGGFRKTALTIGIGANVTLGTIRWGSCSTCLDVVGGVVTYETSTISNATLAVVSTLGGLANGESSANIDRCGHGVEINSGGRVIQDEVNITNPRIAASVARPNMAWNGGYWLSVSSVGLDTILTRRCIIVDGAKVGNTAGWVAGGSGSDAAIARLASLPASQTNSTLVVPIRGLGIGDYIVSWSLSGQLEATSGNTITLNAQLRKLGVAFTGLVDSQILPSMTTIITTADVTISTAATAGTNINASVIVNTTGIVPPNKESVSEGETYYFLITATTGVGNDIKLAAIEVEIGR